MLEVLEFTSKYKVNWNGYLTVGVFNIGENLEFVRQQIRKQSSAPRTFPNLLRIYSTLQTYRNMFHVILSDFHYQNSIFELFGGLISLSLEIWHLNDTEINNCSAASSRWSNQPSVG